MLASTFASDSLPLSLPLAFTGSGSGFCSVESHFLVLVLLRNGLAPMAQPDYQGHGNFIKNAASSKLNLSRFILRLAAGGSGSGTPSGLAGALEVAALQWPSLASFLHPITVLAQSATLTVGSGCLRLWPGLSGGCYLSGFVLCLAVAWPGASSYAWVAQWPFYQQLPIYHYQGQWPPRGLKS